MTHFSNHSLTNIFSSPILEPQTYFSRRVCLFHSFTQISWSKCRKSRTHKTKSDENYIINAWFPTTSGFSTLPSNAVSLISSLPSPKPPSHTLHHSPHTSYFTTSFLKDDCGPYFIKTTQSTETAFNFVPRNLYTHMSHSLLFPSIKESKKCPSTCLTYVPGSVSLFLHGKLTLPIIPCISYQPLPRHYVP